MTDLENSPDLARELLRQLEKEQEIKQKNKEILDNLTQEIIHSEYNEDEKKRYMETVSGNNYKN